MLRPRGWQITAVSLSGTSFRACMSRRKYRPSRRHGCLSKACSGRQRFVEGLEGLYAYQTGLTPPLTYGPNRRIGARGAHLVTVDLVNKTYVPVGNGWHDIR